MSAIDGRHPSSSLLIFFIGAVTILTAPSTSSSLDSFIFSGCTVEKYTPNSPYDSNLNQLLRHLVASSTATAFANFTVVASAAQDTIYGLYQCRGDIAPGDCSQCVAGAVSRLGTICSGACGGALQLEGCFVKYDNKSFFGVDDGTVVLKKCGAVAIGPDSPASSELDSALTELVSGGGTYRSGGAGDVRSVAQCVGDLSVGQCQGCISDAIGRLKSACGASDDGDLFLAKCYARFTRGAPHAQVYGNMYGYEKKDGNDNDNETNKTLAIIIGLIAAVALLIILITWFNKRCEKARGGKEVTRTRAM